MRGACGGSGGSGGSEGSGERRQAHAVRHGARAVSAVPRRAGVGPVSGRWRTGAAGAGRAAGAAREGSRARGRASSATRLSRCVVRHAAGRGLLRDHNTHTNIGVIVLVRYYFSIICETVASDGCLNLSNFIIRTF